MLHINCHDGLNVQADLEMYYVYQETTDYARPIVFAVQVGLQNSDYGPVLDDSWPTVVRTEVSWLMVSLLSSC